MKLGEKIRYLREIEGSLRGLDRAMTQQELVRAIRAEMDTAVSQSYLSQIESGARPHLTNTTRLLLARFFKVHPAIWSTTRRATTRNSALTRARCTSARRKTRSTCG